MNLFLLNGLFFYISLKDEYKKYGNLKVCRIDCIAYVVI